MSFLIHLENKETWDNQKTFPGADGELGDFLDSGNYNIYQFTVSKYILSSKVKKKMKPIKSNVQQLNIEILSPAAATDPGHPGGHVVSVITMNPSRCYPPSVKHNQ